MKKILPILFCIFIITTTFCQHEKALIKEIDIDVNNRPYDLFKCGNDTENMYFVVSAFTRFSHDPDLFSKFGRYSYPDNDKTTFYKLNKTSLLLEEIISIKTKKAFETPNGKNFAVDYTHISNSKIYFIYSYQDTDSKATCMSYSAFDFNGNLIENKIIAISSLTKKKNGQPFYLELKDGEIILSDFNSRDFDGNLNKYYIDQNFNITSFHLSTIKDASVLQETSLPNNETLLLMQQNDDSSKYEFDLYLFQKDIEIMHKKLEFKDKKIVDIKLTKDNNQVFLFATYQINKNKDKKEENGWISYLYDVNSKTEYQDSKIFSDSIVKDFTPKKKYKSPNIIILDILSKNKAFFPVCERSSEGGSNLRTPTYITHAPAHLGQTGVLGPSTTTMSSMGGGGVGYLATFMSSYVFEFSNTANLLNDWVIKKAHTATTHKAGSCIPFVKDNSIVLYYIDNSENEALFPLHGLTPKAVGFYDGGIVIGKNKINNNLVEVTITEKEMKYDVILSLGKGFAYTQNQYWDTNGNLFLLNKDKKKYSFIKISE